jgi:hypothetical protein
MRIPLHRAASYAALAFAALLVAITINVGGFVAGGTDSSGYISAADLWRSGSLYRPEPLHFWAAWGNATESASPVAYRPGVIRGTEVSVYPLGFPLLCAAASALAGPLASYLVAPVMGGALVFCAFVLARRLAGAWAGLLAAVLLASSPVMLYHTVHPMSDVPAAAGWAVAWCLALRGTTSAGLAAGFAASMAVLIRPNLAPLAIVPAAIVLLGQPTRLGGARDWRWRAAFAFIVCAAVGPLLVGWSQATLYGSPFVPGYVEWESFFRLSHVWPNLEMYPRLLARAHTLLPLAGLIVPLLALVGTRRFVTHEARVVALSAAAMFVINVALYLPYLSIDDWPSLRFLLPALTALFVLFASLVADVSRAVWLSRARWAAVVVPLAAVVVVVQGMPFARYALGDWYVQSRIRLMGHYLREALPPNAIVLSFMHSGEIAHYTDRQVLRMDVLDPRALDGIVDDLTRYGYRPVFVLDDAMEVGPFREVFAASRLARLDWPPRAVFATGISISYFDIADREPYQQGARWATDVLR